NFKAEVIDVIVAPNKQHVHIVNVIEGTISLYDKVTAKIDKKRRNNIAKNHSATHLLETALRDALKYEVTQAGSKVTDKYLRFDFTYPNKITDEEVMLVENLVNEMIDTKVDTVTKVMPLEEAKESGAIHQFDEKYDDMVRVVTISNSVQLCGGTHVSNVGDINKFAIKSIETKGANIYRIEGATDENIIPELFEIIKPYNDEMIKLLNKAKGIMDMSMKDEINIDFDVEIDNSKPTCYKDIIFNRNEVQMVRDKVKELEKEYNLRKNEKEVKNTTDFDNIKKKNDIEYIVKRVDNYDINILKQIIDNVFNNMKYGIIFVANVKDDNVNYLCRSNCDLEAGVLVKEASIKSKGNGGGSKNFAQGGGTDISNIKDILKDIEYQIGEL
ncbi:MAG TPA: DHHA1 domain-containing protein, partial [Bacilli bacterium]|nr:DHHA1 domain-containing protein [Bacilli bacterium]